MTTSRQYAARRKAEYDAAVAAGKDPNDFQRNDNGEILCGVEVEASTFTRRPFVCLGLDELIERYRIDNTNIITPEIFSFDVPESEVEPFMTELRKIGCDNINNHGRINASGIPEDLD
jgi:hypothetical protein